MQTELAAPAARFFFPASYGVDKKQTVTAVATEGVVYCAVQWLVAVSDCIATHAHCTYTCMFTRIGTYTHIRFFIY